VKVLDFGISKLAGDVQASVTTTASAFGTPLYMSPEQVRSAKHVDARTDVWALGVVLYELIAGVPPFNRDSATAILAAIVVDKPVRLDERRKDVPSGLAKAVMKALEKDPRARYSDVRDFAAALAPYGPPRDDPSLTGIAAELAMPRSAGGPVLADTGFPDMTAAPPRSRKLVIAVAAVALALFLVTAFFVIRPHDPVPTAALDSIPTAQTAGVTAPAPAPSSAPIAIEPTAPEPTTKPATPPRPTATPSTPTSSGSARPKATATAAPPPSSAPTTTSDPKYL
jgi:hypothetical protein